MKDNALQSVLERVYAADVPDRDDIAYLLQLQGEDELRRLFGSADKVRAEYCGDGILLRGLVEFSSYCRNTCFYCGLNRQNVNVERYRLSVEEIMDAVDRIAAKGIRTVVLQSGEDDELDAAWLADLVQRIKQRFDMAVTLAVGERPAQEYKLWRQAGADRYLLKIETTDAALYRRLHPHMSFENRLACLETLRDLGYQVGSGSLVGLKGQTVQSLVEDVLFFKRANFDMIGIGLFIPHEATPLAAEPMGDLELTLKVLAVTRIVTRSAHLPATTAVGSVSGDARLRALQAGANVLMPNFTPAAYRSLYEIYPYKRCVKEDPAAAVDGVAAAVRTIGRTIDYARGDSLKTACAGVLHNPTI
ncbi:MAG: [FeFe] hydrogenase H-cluster radical SAM maturase HydE [Anaerohalosphaeraceae bacterium]|jgi:biotin synthase